MLHYKNHEHLLTELTVPKAFQSCVFHLSIEKAAMKTQHFANVGEVVLALLLPLTSPLRFPYIIKDDISEGL